MSAPHLLRRLVSLFVSILIALASGTPYLYGVYAPQLLNRIGLNASDSAIISLATSLGSGIGGIPAGMIIDGRGPRLSILIGSLSILIGYFGLYKIYQEQIARLVLVCLSMIVMGFGSIMCYFSTLKAAQMNFPRNRGAAGALPVSAFGLSATMFSLIMANIYSSDTGAFLRFLSVFCGLVTFFGSFFIHIHLDEDQGDDSSNISGFMDEESALLGGSESSSVIVEERFLLNTSLMKQLKKPKLKRQYSLSGSFSFWGIGQRTPRNSDSSISSEIPQSVRNLRDQYSNTTSSATKNEPFLSRSNSKISITESPKSKQILPAKDENRVKNGSSIEVIKCLLRDKLFLLHFITVALASGVGQMYIYSVGFVVTSQYEYEKHHEGIELLHSLIKVQPTVGSLQALQVSIISVGSFSGRLLSGFLSDFIYMKYHVQRLWIILATIVLLGCGQFIAIVNVSDPTLVSLTSAIIGGSYGLIFGTYPAVMADNFGARTFSTTWGLICSGPSVTLFFLNKYFGSIYDKHTNKEGVCILGNDCYKGAFELSFILCFVIFFLVLLLIYLQRYNR